MSDNGRRLDDPVYKWFKEREKYMCAWESLEIQLVQTRLCRQYNGFGGSRIPGEREYADPWVVATAKVCGAIVIAHERNRRSSQEKFRIPEVCVKEDLECSPIYRIVKDSGRTFRL